MSAGAAPSSPPRVLRAKESGPRAGLRRQHTPWRVPHRVLFHDVPCRHCYKSVCPQGHHACLREVKPAEVADAALALLAGTEHRRR